MELYIIRHPKPDVAKGICYGSSDIDLPENYMDDLGPLFSEVQALAGSTVTRVVSSPLQRALKLGRALAGHFSLELEISPLLREYDFGEWEMCSYDDLWQDLPAFRQWIEHWETAVTPAGDSLPLMIDRVKEFVMHSDLSGSLLVSHVGVVRILMHLLTGITLKDAFAVEVPFGELLRIQGTLQ